MSDFRLYPATPLDGDPPTPVPRWQPNGPHGALAQVEGFFVWVERDAAGDYAVHYLGRVSPPVPSQAAAQALAPAFARRVIRNRLHVDHALAADVYHTAERGGWAAPPLARVMVPIAALAHARQAGRVDALAGQDLAAASGHVSAFPALLAAYEAGYAEGEEARFALGAQAGGPAFVRACLIVRADFDRAVYRQDEAAIHDAVDAICGVAEHYPAFRLRFFEDVPEARDIAELTDWIVAARCKWDGRQQARQDVQARLEARLPSAVNEASGPGASLDFEGYTLWHEPEAGGWSVTNAYGIDHCAFLSCERDFARLIDAVRTGRDLGPVPLVGDATEEADDHPDVAAMVRAHDIAQAVARRAGAGVGEPAPTADQPQQRLASRHAGLGGGA
ncbi:hypothetical protein [Burkholderia gladioli]|uniref:hypothetical protein n=1 Tax=Burkholderia gladioli TaxID=28095 RepID=UPI000CFEAE9B|nr:hypothetical protein [Burkholderia gladioli]MDN7465761.1 hypothetical protein [Burkholderia gladioli]MDN7812929.1 hypothetical protein [Burkholderia gladioli]PRE10766.1 hypothetical protein C6P72_34630 [Burkholderia gladioli]